MSNFSFNDASEQHPHFPSGEWEGFYLYGFGPGHRKHPMRFHLNFNNGHVSGSGGDDVGAFQWKGRYETTGGIIGMTKQYIGRHRVAYDGRADDNGIYGTWLLSGWKGGFHIWPKGRDNSNQATEEEVEELELIFTIVEQPPRNW